MNIRSAKILTGKSVQLRTAPIHATKETVRHEANRRCFATLRKAVKMEECYTLILVAATPLCFKIQ
jgi:hypothetical protein